MAKKKRRRNARSRRGKPGGSDLATIAAFVGIPLAMAAVLVFAARRRQVTASN